MDSSRLDGSLKDIIDNPDSVSYTEVHIFVPDGREMGKSQVLMLPSTTEELSRSVQRYLSSWNTFKEQSFIEQHNKSSSTIKKDKIIADRNIGGYINITPSSNEKLISLFKDAKDRNKPVFMIAYNSNYISNEDIDKTLDSFNRGFGEEEWDHNTTRLLNDNFVESRMNVLNMDNDMAKCIENVNTLSYAEIHIFTPDGIEFDKSLVTRLPSIGGGSQAAYSNIVKRALLSYNNYENQSYKEKNTDNPVTKNLLDKITLPSDLPDLFIKAKEVNKPIFLISYDPKFVKEISLKKDLDLLMCYEPTKKFILDNFLIIIMKADNSFEDSDKSYVKSCINQSYPYGQVLNPKGELLESFFLPSILEDVPVIREKLTQLLSTYNWISKRNSAD